MKKRALDTEGVPSREVGPGMRPGRVVRHFLFLSGVNNPLILLDRILLFQPPNTRGNIRPVV